MAAKRYQENYQFRPGQNPYQYAEGIRSPAPPRLTAPPSAPNLRRPRITPAEATMRGEAALGSQLTKMLDSWANVAYSHATEEAKIEGKKAGLRAGLGQVDAPELRGDNTFYGQAYDEGALLAHQSAAGIDIKESMNRLGREYSHDPQNFKKATESYREGLLESISPDLQVWANETINTSASSIGIEVENNFLNRKREQEIAIIHVRKTQLMQEYLAASRAGSKEEQAAKERELLLLIEKEVALEYITPTNAIKAINTMIEESQFYMARGEFTRLIQEEGTDHAEGVWVKFMEEPPKDMAPKLQGRISNEMESQLRDRIWVKDRKEAEIEKRVKAGQNAYFEKLLLFEARGNLKMGTIQTALYDRTINAQMFQTLKGLLESDMAEQESRRNTQVIGSIWNEIYNGVDEERAGEIKEYIISLLGTGIDAGTGRGMFNVLSSPEYQAVTKEPGYNTALNQITTSLGRGSGLMAILDPNTADTVAAARRELYDRVSDGEDAMEIVAGIINRAKMFNDQYEPEPFMIAPQYSVSNEEGNFDLKASLARLKTAWENKEIELPAYKRIFDQLMEYQQFKQTKGYDFINEQDNLQKKMSVEQDQPQGGVW